MTILNIYHFKGYPKPIRSKLNNQSVFLFYDNRKDAEEASSIAKSKWEEAVPRLNHPAYSSLGIGEIQDMSDGQYCVQIP